MHYTCRNPEIFRSRGGASGPGARQIEPTAAGLLDAAVAQVLLARDGHGVLELARTASRAERVRPSQLAGLGCGISVPHEF